MTDPLLRWQPPVRVVPPVTVGRIVGVPAVAGTERVLGQPLNGGGRVRQPGGSVEIRWDAAARVLEMTGGARLVATGEALLEPRARPADGLTRGPTTYDTQRPLTGIPASG